MKQNLHKCITSNDINMKFGLVTKIDKKTKTTSKKFDDNVMSANRDTIALFQIYD